MFWLNELWIVEFWLEFWLDEFWLDEFWLDEFWLDEFWLDEFWTIFIWLSEALDLLSVLSLAPVNCIVYIVCSFQCALCSVLGAVGNLFCSVFSV